MNELKMYVTSWGRYNRGLSGCYIDLNGIKDYDDVIEELKEKGFDLQGLDEELTVHDYVEGSICNLMNEKFGEWFNENTIEWANELLNLDENEIEIILAYAEIHGIHSACENDIQYILDRNYIYEDIEEFLNEMYDIPERLQSYIDYELMIKYDSIYKLEDGNYLVTIE